MAFFEKRVSQGPELGDRPIEVGCPLLDLAALEKNLKIPMPLRQLLIVEKAPCLFTLFEGQRQKPLEPAAVVGQCQTPGDQQQIILAVRQRLLTLRAGIL